MIKELLDLYLNSGFIRIELRGNNGVLTEIPLIASSLIKQGLELCDDSRVTPEKILEYYWLERRQSDIRHLPKDLYVKARLTMYENFVKGNEKAVKQIQSQLRELAQARLKKILTAVVMNPELSTTHEFLEKLTIEEEVLVREIAHIVRDWLNYILGLY